MQTRLPRPNLISNPIQISWWYRITCSLILWITLTSVVLAQRKEWDKTFGSEGYYGTDDAGNDDAGNDYLRRMIATIDGGYLLAGSSFPSYDEDLSPDEDNLGPSEPGRGNYDFWVVKINKDGAKIWDRIFGGSNRDDLFTIVPTADGGYLLGGSSASGISGDKSQASRGNTDFWIVKITSNGAKVWDKRFGGSGNDNLSTIIATADGNFLLGGTSDSGVSGDMSGASKGRSDFWVVKIDANGVKIWDKTFGGSGSEDLSAIVPVSEGGYVLGVLPLPMSVVIKPNPPRVVLTFGRLRLMPKVTKCGISDLVAMIMNH